MTFKRAVALTHDLPQKPLFGKPCNGCGLCCLSETCELAKELIPKASERSICPALEFQDGRYRCGMVQRPHSYIPGLEEKPWADRVIIPMVIASLGINIFCDSDD